MKKKTFIGVIIIALGLIIAVGPFTLFHVCRPDDPDMYMKCYWTARAELGFGIEISLLGLLTAILNSGRIKTGLNIAVLLNGIFAFSIPNFLIGVCDGKHMHCHAVALPAFSILSVVLIIVAVIGIILFPGIGENKNGI